MVMETIFLFKVEKYMVLISEALGPAGTCGSPVADFENHSPARFWSHSDS